MNLNLSGKVALVCGGSKGIGYASAVELAKLGARIILVSRTEASLQSRVKELSQINDQEHEYIAVDMSDRSALGEGVKKHLDKGPIHIVLNNTGGPPAGSIVRATPDQFLAAMQGHLLVNHSLAQLLIPGMREAGYGRIINMVSTSVRQPIDGLGVSNTTRGAVASWAKTLSTELAPDGITVNNVLPGATKTERLEQIIDARTESSGRKKDVIVETFLDEIPMYRFAEPEEIGSMVAFLASPAAAYITGVSIPVDGGRIRCI